MTIIDKAAEAAAEKILEDLNDRRGVKQTLRACGTKMLAEMHKIHTAIIATKFQKALKEYFDEEIEKFAELISRSPIDTPGRDHWRNKQRTVKQARNDLLKEQPKGDK